MHWFGLPLASNNWFFPLLNTRYFHFVFKVSDFWAWLAEAVLIFLLRRKKTLHCIIDTPSLPFIISMGRQQLLPSQVFPEKVLLGLVSSGNRTQVAENTKPILCHCHHPPTPQSRVSKLLCTLFSLFYLYESCQQSTVISDQWNWNVSHLNNQW